MHIKCYEIDLVKCTTLCMHHFKHVHAYTYNPAVPPVTVGLADFSFGSTYLHVYMNVSND